MCYDNRELIKKLVYPKNVNPVSISIFEKTQKKPINNFFP